MSNNFLTIFGFLVIFFATTLGSAVVYLLKKDISPRLNSVFLGFASGIMIAASIWSLLIPAIDMSGNWGAINWVPATLGFLVGGLFLVLLDHVVPHLHPATDLEEGPHTSLSKSVKLFLAITIHNIPEGLSVGFAFGVASALGQPAAYMSALGLALGIAIQNFPEGAAVSLPMMQTLKSKHKAFVFGMGSGVVEPIAAIIGYFLATQLQFLQPWLLAFAAGAMIFVVAEDLIPAASLDDNIHLGTWGLMFGFVIMMILDVAFG